MGFDQSSISTKTNSTQPWITFSHYISQPQNQSKNFSMNSHDIWHDMTWHMIRLNNLISSLIFSCQICHFDPNKGNFKIILGHLTPFSDYIKITVWIFFSKSFYKCCDHTFFLAKIWLRSWLWWHHLIPVGGYIFNGHPTCHMNNLIFTLIFSCQLSEDGNEYIYIYILESNGAIRIKIHAIYI